MARVAIAISIVLVITSPAVAQNLLVNPGFDDPDQLDGWTCTTNDGGIAVWSPEDHQGSTGSGSMEHEVSAAIDDRWVRCWQCVPVRQYWPYVGSAWYYWPNDPDVSKDGKTVVTMSFFSDANCTVSLSSGGGHNAFPVLDTWVQTVTSEFVAPAGANSAAFYVFTWQYTANQPVRARLDDLDFSARVLFWDDFESGGTGAWSATNP